MSDPLPTTEDHDERDSLLSPQQLADYLGIPVTTLYQWRYRAEGPSGSKLGNHVRYRWVDVQAWLAAHADQPSGGR